jgi:hypothetical protein
MTCSSGFTHRLTVCLLLLLLWTAPALLLAQEATKSGESPSDLAHATFEALQRNDLAKFVSYFHPDELNRFQAFAVEVFKSSESDKKAGKEPDKEIEQLQKTFAPFDSAEKIAAAKGTDLLAAFLKNTLTSNPEVVKLLASAKLQVLGEIAEGEDKVHVITRTLLPRPQPTSCQKLDGSWRLLLNNETLQIMDAFARKTHIRKKGITLEEVAQRTKLDQVEVVGRVMDGEETAQVLCRVKMKFDDIGYALLACYPVREGEPAWDLLGDKDRAKLADALMSKWKK